MAKLLSVLLGSFALVGFVGCQTSPIGETSSPVQGLSTAQIAGFESLQGWTATSGTLSQSTTHSQGSYSLGLVGNGWVELRSQPMTLTAAGYLAVDLELPTQQPNPNYYGQIEAFVDGPGVNHQYLGYFGLTGLPLGSFVTANFTVPSALLSQLKGISSMQISHDITIPSGESNPYLFDNLRFVSAINCNDNNACTTDANVNGICTHTAVSAGTSCSDGNACNGLEVCGSSGNCLPGTPPVINTSNPCEVGSCDPIKGVTYSPAPSGTTCGGDQCVGISTCDGKGTCDPGTPPVISTSNPCEVGSCDPVKGVIYTPAPSGTTCGGDQCAGISKCNATGTCEPGTPAVISTSNPCEVGSCDPVKGVTYSPASAGTTCGGDQCVGISTCNASGTCVPGTPAVISTSNPCMVGTCDPVKGVSYAPVAAGTTCGGDQCVGIATCNAVGTCVPGTPAVISHSNPCEVGSCDPVKGVTYTPVASGTTCGGDQCAGISKCNSSGTCTPGTPAVINNSNPCAVGSCDPVKGVTYTPVASGTTCGGDQCAGISKCNATGTCVAGTPPVIKPLPS